MDIQGSQERRIMNGSINAWVGVALMWVSLGMQQLVNAVRLESRVNCDACSRARR